MAKDLHSSIGRLEGSKFQEMMDSIIDQIQKLKQEIIPETRINRPPPKLAIRDTNSPHFVSVGPIHSGKPDLLAMEEIKLWYSMFFFSRSEDLIGTVQEYSAAIMTLHKQAQEYYAHDLTMFDKYKLMNILLVDSCFLLKLFLRHSNEQEHGSNVIVNGKITMGSYDLIFGNTWMRNAVCKDLVLLDNQIPLFVLETLLSKIKPKLSYSAQEYILAFFSSGFVTRNETSICIDEENPRPIKEPKYILEMLHKGLLPWQLINGKKLYGLMYSATKLMESGVNIKQNVDLSNNTDAFNCDLLKIEFDSSGGILKIPQFWIGGTTSLITKNLVTFEQCSIGWSQSHHVTAYVMFMKTLMSSEKDVMLLKKKGVIKMHPGSESDYQNVMEFFNDCSEGVALKDFYFSNFYEEVDDYRKKNWMYFHGYVTSIQSLGRKYKAILARRICPDPCTTIAFFAATMFLLLTGLQTFYAVYAYYRKRQ